MIKMSRIIESNPIILWGILLLALNTMHNLAGQEIAATAWLR